MFSHQSTTPYNLESHRAMYLLQDRNYRVLVTSHSHFEPGPYRRASRKSPGLCVNTTQQRKVQPIDHATTLVQDLPPMGTSLTWLTRAYGLGAITYCLYAVWRPSWNQCEVDGDEEYCERERQRPELLALVRARCVAVAFVDVHGRSLRSEGRRAGVCG